MTDAPLPPLAPAAFPFVLKRAKFPRYLRGFMAGQFLWTGNLEHALRFAVAPAYIMGICSRMPEKAKAVAYADCVRN